MGEQGRGDGTGIRVPSHNTPLTLWLYLALPEKGGTVRFVVL